MVVCIAAVFIGDVRAESKSCDADTQSCVICDDNNSCKTVPMEGKTNGGDG